MNTKLFTRTSIPLLTLMLAIALLLAGCGQAANDKESANEPAKETATEATTEQQNNSADTEEVREIEHAMGKTTIKGVPQRVVILTNEGTEALLALGMKPVGAVNSWTGDPWYEHITKDMEGVTPVGEESQVNLEAIAALKPDLILGNKMRQEKVYQQLSAIAPTVFSETLRGQWKDNFQLYAKALNLEEKGNEVLGAFDTRIADLKQKFADKLSMKVSIVRFMPGVIRLYQKDSFSGIIFNDIGFARTAAEDKDAFTEEITRERIPDMDGDILFYFTYEKGDGQATKQQDEILNDQLFQNLSVAKAGNVYEVSDTIWNTAGGVIAANLLLDDIDKFFTAVK